MALQSLLLLLAQYWVPILFLSILAYLLQNHFNHGLNAYPGPFLASLSNWWRFWDVYGRRPDITHTLLHRRHGSVVRLGPNCLSYASPRAQKDIYGLNKGFTKSGFYPVQQSVSHGHRLPSLFSTTDDSFHAALRRSVSSAFSMSSLVQYEPLVDEATALFLSQTGAFYARSGALCNFTRWLQFYAFDTIGNLTYSKHHGFLDHNEDVDGIVAYLGWIFSYVAPVGQIPLLDLLLLKNPLYLAASRYGWIDSTFPVARFARASLQERKHRAELAAAEEKPAPPGPPDLLHRFLGAQAAHPSVVGEKEVLTLATSMAFAGSDTTAISLSAIFYYLLKTPAALARLRTELDDAARRGHFSNAVTGLVTWAESQRLPYLDAVIKEAFRMHPAAGLPLERVVPAGGAEIDGRYVAGGTIVGCSAWVMHRLPAVFGEDADVFRPERWLVGGSEEGKARLRGMNGVMMHFGLGSRTCIGKNISLLEIYKVVPSMLRRFEIALEWPEKEWKLHNAWFVKQLDFNVRFEPRKLVKAEV